MFQKSFKELRDAGQLRVFATAGGNTASNLVDLSGVSVAQGLADKGYVYTDRPAYRAGQLVHVRGVLRKASDDAYVIEKGRKYTVEVFDSRNRVVWQNEVTLSEFGSFHAHFSCPPRRPRESIASRSATTRTALRRHVPRPRVPARAGPAGGRDRSQGLLSRRGDRGHNHRGLLLRGAAGGSRNSLPIGRRPVQTATTDDKGEVHFKLATRDFSETQVLPLLVTLPERNLATTQNFFLSTTGFSLNVSTLRPVYTSGETFEATVKAIDAEGKPIAQKIVLQVLEQTTVAGKVGEVEAGQYDLTTDAKEGTARQTLKLEKGARYVLRAEGTDRFKNPITGQHVVQVSDDTDRVRLRILADKHTYKVGDTAEVQLHWREEPALALVTFQGARILDYRLVTLQTGANKFSIPMAAKLAPNFNLAVTVMTDARAPKPPQKPTRPIARFHLANSPFVVERDLRVELTARRKGGGTERIRPGDELELLVKTTDPQGKPVAAELSVAMIEQSLLSMFAWNVEPIQDFFRGRPREPAMRTSTSVTFAYQPATRAIDRNLLAETERLEIAADEAAHLTVVASLATAGESSAAATPAAEPEGEATDLDRDGALALDITAETWDANANGAASQFAAAGRQGGDRRLGARLQIRGSLAQDDFAAKGQNSAQPEQRLEPFFVRSGPDDPREQSRRLRDLGGMGGGGHGANRPAGGAVIVGGADADGDGKLGIVNGRSYAQWHMLAQDDVKLGDVRYSNSAAVPSLQNFNGYWNEGRKDLVVMLTNGEQRNVSLGFVTNGNFDTDAATKAAGQLAAAGAVLLPQDSSQETGYWNPVVVTDGKGEAVLSLSAPEQSTAWKLIARGTTHETLTGEGQSDLVAKKDLFGELRLPRAFTDGDEADVLVNVHNQLLDKGTIIGGAENHDRQPRCRGERRRSRSNARASRRLPSTCRFAARPANRPTTRQQRPRPPRPAAIRRPQARFCSSCPLLPKKQVTTFAARWRCSPTACRSMSPPAAARPATLRSGSRPRSTFRWSTRSCRFSSVRPSSGACWTSSSARRRPASSTRPDSPRASTRPPAT